MIPSSRSALLSMAAALIVLLPATAPAAAQVLPTLVIEPDPPTAQQPFTATITYDGPCFVDARVSVFGHAARVVAIEDPICITAIVPRTFEVEIPGLPAGDAVLILTRDPLPTEAGDPPETLIQSFQFDVGPTAGGIFAADLREADGDWFLDLVQECPFFSVFEARPPSSGVIRVRQIIPPSLPFPDCTAQGPFIPTSIGIGALEPGPYTIAIGAVDDRTDAFDLLIPFTVPEPDDLVAPALQRGRYAARVDWQRAEDSGTGFARMLSEDAAAFWFFRPSNTELLVKVLDGCLVNGHVWVFAAGLTNQGVTLTVEDLATSITRTWRSPLGTPFTPILDTRAFDCDP